MIKVDINKTSFAGLILGLAAVLMAIFDNTIGNPVVGTLLGPDAPFAPVALWAMLALLALFVYIAGRLIWLFREGIR